MNIEAYDVESLMKLVRLLEYENRLLKEKMKKENIPYDEVNPFDSYDLVGFIYSKVDLEKRWGDCGDLFDDFANEALKVDLMKDPYYQFWRDPKILEISRKYGKK